MSKVGVIKVWWENKEEEYEETRWGLSDVQYGMLLQDKSVKIIEHTARLGLVGQQPLDEGAY